MSRTSDPTYRRNRAKTLAGDNLTCAWCNKPIDKTLKAPHPMSPSTDHITPIKHGGHNHGPLQPMHLACNSQRGAKHYTTKPPKHIREW